MKQLLTAVIVSVISTSASAEPESGVALKGGPNAATLNEPYRVNRYGASGGLAGYLQWPLIGRWLLASQIELLYTPRGAEVIYEGEYVGRSRENYLDVTMAARPEARLGRASVYLLIGAGLNLLLNATDENAWGATKDITDELNRVDVALLAGAGVALHLPRRAMGPFRLGTVFLEARHDHGLLDSDPFNGGFKNRTSSVMLGLSFTLPSGAADARPAGTPGRSEPPPVAAAAAASAVPAGAR